MKKLALIMIVAGLIIGGYFMWNKSGKGGDNLAMDIPNINKDINISVEVPAESLASAMTAIDGIRGKLEENNDDFGAWLDLGLYYESLGDYEGAREYWEYASKIRPDNGLSFTNLGHLYGYRLNDPDKAEENYKTALNNLKTRIDMWANLSRFYLEVRQDVDKSIEVLENAKVELPEQVDIIDQAISQIKQQYNQ